jgi:hypothetical protein
MPSPRSLLIALVGLSAACDRAAIVESAPPAVSAGASRTVTSGDPSVYVANVEQLYSAVNNPENAGAAIVLAAGTYVLSATSGGIARPNGGRLELQPGMSLTGVAGDRSAVVIDMSALPISSFNASIGLTGGIRLGRGSNAVEWLTIVGQPKSAGAVETDLADSHPTEVTVSHVVTRGSGRGVDVRNTTTAMAGRSIDARIEDNEFFDGGEGVRLLNLNVIGAHIDATMSGNRMHDNKVGCLIEHNRASSGSIHVRSSGDRFEHNALGCLIGGGLVAGVAPGGANSNSTAFEAYGDAFVDNTLDVPAIDYGGVLVLGAETPGLANSASHNTVSVALWGTRVSGNQNVDFQAYGARSIAIPPGISGIDNHVTIELHGVSRQIDVDAVNSMPVDPTGTNSVTVVR